jgi:hypothetical protein
MYGAIKMEVDMAKVNGGFTERESEKNGENTLEGQGNRERRKIRVLLLLWAK